MNSKVEVVGIDDITKNVLSCISLVEIGVSFFDITKSIFINRGGGRDTFVKSFSCPLTVTDAYPYMCAVAIYTMALPTVLFCRISRIKITSPKYNGGWPNYLKYPCFHYPSAQPFC